VLLLRLAAHAVLLGVLQIQEMLYVMLGIYTSRGHKELSQVRPASTGQQCSQLQFDCSKLLLAGQQRVGGWVGLSSQQSFSKQLFASSCTTWASSPCKQQQGTSVQALRSLDRTYLHY
jgi:hypothetical protein